MKPRAFLWSLALSALCLLPVEAVAQVTTNDGVDRILNRFHTTSAAWVGPIQNIALATFGGLAVIDLVYFVAIKQLTSGHFELGNFMHAVVHETLYLSFFFWMLVAFPVTAPLIIKGFQMAAGVVGGAPLTPNAVFNAGNDISKVIGDQASIWQPGDAIVMMLCGLIVQGCFVWIVIGMIYVIVESYFVVTAAQIVLMFGGIRFGSDAPINLYRTVISIGLKLYCLQLIASVGTAMVQGWLADSAANVVTFQGILYEIGETVILAAITTSVPHMFERLVGGVGTGGASNVLGAGATIAAAGTIMGKAAAKAFTSAAGGIAATASAGRLAAAQAEASGAHSGMAAEERAIRLVGSTARNLAVSAAQDVGRGLSGTRSGLGKTSWRMADQMAEQRRSLGEKQEKAAAKTTPPTTGTTKP